MKADPDLKAETAFTLSLRDLKRTPGARTEFDFSAEFSQAVRTGLLALPKDRSVQVHGSLESVGDGVLVTAQASVELDAQCARCLSEFTCEVVTTISELFIYPEQASDYQAEDVCFIDDDQIDLSGAVRDGLILEQPLIPLCRVDCEGLCTICGVDRNADPDHNHDDSVDSRWLGLSQWGKMS
ncbi:MAG: YceD family protein [Propionibacteriaceae bacterium]|jgi:uncharacterized protein|nr:YceD family protein [Propionibacteriaceae bacterium]